MSDATTTPYRTSLRTAADWGLVAIALPALAALALPLGRLADGGAGGAVGWFGGTMAPLFLIGVVLAVVAGASAPKRVWGAWAELAGVALAWLLPLHLLNEGVDLSAGWGLWLFLLAATLLLWRVMAVLAGVPGWTRAVIVPGLFGLGLLVGWEVLVRGFQVPAILLPPPSRIAAALAVNAPVLWDDFRQTVLTSVLRGYVMGCGAGFLVAILADRVPFLARGLLPLGNLASAIPVVGIAPIMVMWFGFDWQSKAAVIVVMTFFPMLINTLAGLGNSERIQLDLMRSYAAGHARTLVKLRLPNALPFLFNGLKINSTLALIGAIVAEFFGTPVVGMGFRISTEVARMNLDIVWATIAVAALTGSGLYGGLALVERLTTSWHPSMRQR
ncbi:ABC transporter permease [Azospirillum thiophilum]|uniref:ABC transporter permease n=1 Tax=Azospirillum thiophilum TaxID=528244 RepID=A0AAC8VUU3_9PROT|nr:ABC transporter permease [Azospirillum thiophilum]ALG69840.1 ABC transporter permease [Azospirillum thiophilum]KJR66476.1 ABC transporter permease [Azospirillum thiophilum]